MSNLERIISNLGLCKMPITGDGNCLYRCLGHVIGLEHQVIRSEIINYIINNKSLFLYNFDSMDQLNNWIVEQIRPGTHGNSLVIYAFTLMYSWHVHLYIDTILSTGRIIPTKFQELQCTVVHGTVKILYSNGNHYDLLFDHQAPTSSLPGTPSRKFSTEPLHTSSLKWDHKLRPIRSNNLLDLIGVASMMDVIKRAQQGICPDKNDFPVTVHLVDLLGLR